MSYECRVYLELLNTLFCYLMKAKGRIGVNAVLQKGASAKQSAARPRAAGTGSSRLPASSTVGIHTMRGWLAYYTYCGYSYYGESRCD